jgi:hypothetical protein
MSRCGYIIPPNLYPKTHVLKKKLILQPRNNQVQHIVVKVMGGNMGKDGDKGEIAQVAILSRVRWRWSKEV